MNIKRILSKYYINLRGWRTNRKIVVIESDDWGSIRMASRESYNYLLRKDYPVDKSKFTSLDGLERTEDLKILFQVLKSYKDKNGNHPVITALSLVANPDFNKIRNSDFKTYYFETIDETYKNYGEDGLLELWIKYGIKDNLLYPQFHGREHLNTQKWLKVLNDDNKMEKEAFSSKTLLGILGSETVFKDNYMAAFESISSLHEQNIKKITIEGLNLFKKIFGFTSLSFMPSQSKQFGALNRTLVEKGVLFNQGGQYFSPRRDGSFKQIDKIWGERDKYGMTYWRRNCTFEPFKDQNLDHVFSCLKEIEIAFRCGKPAVINSHRINFTSRLNKDHRDHSLEKLNKLLAAILEKWPDVEFMNSEMLGRTILDD